MTFTLIAVAWVSMFGLNWCLFRVSSMADDELEHLDRPVNVEVNRIMYANKRAWKQDILN